MAKVINCECGQTIRADSEDELLDRAQRHIEESHPDLVGTMSRENLLAMAEEE